MAKVQLYEQCRKCGGSGIAHLTSGAIENPCNECLGDKYISSSQQIDLSTADDQAEAAIAVLVIKVDGIVATQAVQDIEIAAIKTMCEKIDNIKNKCDNIKDKCDQIWDKVKDM